MADVIFQMLRPEHLLLYVFAYGLASIPTTYLVARYIHKINLREEKAQSHTAAHVFHNMSKWSGTFVFVVDFLKGFLPAAIAHSLNAPIETIAVVGFFAVLGHCFSFWLWFLGGYGSTTAAGAIGVIYWPASVVILGFNAAVLLTRKNFGTASIVAILFGALAILMGLYNFVVFLCVLAMAVVIIVRHLMSNESKHPRTGSRYTSRRRGAP